MAELFSMAQSVHGHAQSLSQRHTSVEWDYIRVEELSGKKRRENKRWGKVTAQRTVITASDM